MKHLLDIRRVEENNLAGAGFVKGAEFRQRESRSYARRTDTASNGQKLAKGDEILVMDVMKMETPVTAPCDGTVTVTVNATDKVSTGDTLAVIG